jgi:hypothetical protein
VCMFVLLSLGAARFEKIGIFSGAKEGETEVDRN